MNVGDGTNVMGGKYSYILSIIFIWIPIYRDAIKPNIWQNPGIGSYPGSKENYPGSWSPIQLIFKLRLYDGIPKFCSSDLNLKIMEVDFEEK